jgi:putative transposase
MSKNTVVGFLDECSPQTTANTQRLWSFEKKPIIKNTSKIRANTFGIYSPNGNSILTFKSHSKKEDICEVLSEFIDANPNKRIILILDNFSSHRSKLVREFANDHNIILVFLPPYSPDLNPIEQVWRAIKREISKIFVQDLPHLIEIIEEEFYDRVMRKTYILGWAKKFLSSEYYFKMLCD